MMQINLNYNKLYSGLFSLVLVYTIMTTFELIFFVLVVCPVITANIHKLLNSYKFQSNEQNSQYPYPSQFINQIDPSPLLIAQILNEREYKLINDFNLGNYLIIIVIILLLISLLFYLYVKIGIIEDSQNATENLENDIELGASIVTDTDLTLVASRTTTTSQNSNITRRSNIKRIYLRHAIRCALATITCLIFYQIFFYNYGLSFRYVGSTNEMIVLFMETIISR